MLNRTLPASIENVSPLEALRSKSRDKFQQEFQEGGQDASSAEKNSKQLRGQRKT